MLRHTDKVAIVTGTAGGIGSGIIARLGSESARLVLADRSTEGGDQHVQAAKAAGAPDAAMQACGRLDPVVNNAGRGVQARRRADRRRLADVAEGRSARPRRLHQARLPVDSERGAVVNAASIHAMEPLPLVACYAGSKAAVLSLTRTISIEGRPKNIRVNAPLPGAIDTPMLWDNPSIESGAEVVSPDDVGKPEQIALTIAFLGSNGSFVTGASLVTDGGRLAKL